MSIQSMRNRFHAWGFSLWLLAHCIPCGGGTGPLQSAGMMETLEQFKNTADGIAAFVDKIANFTSFIGFSTILLFLGVLILSAGFSVIGIPRGKASFLLSLAACDVIWIAWEQSFYPGQYGYLSLLVKSNALILAPLVLVIVIAFFFPRAGAALNWLFSALTRKKKRSFTKSDMLELFEDYQFSRTDLERHLLKDISRSGDDLVSLSTETMDAAKNLQRTIQRISEEDGTGAVPDTPKKS